MPIGEIETHPYLLKGNINGAEGLILGTFPVYWCTDEDTKQKQELRKEKGAFRFFYGSYRSSFWDLYKCYIDSSLKKPYDAEPILESLTRNRIAISDLILNCERKNDSALDVDLRNIVWNVDGLGELLKRENITKIVCTSKYTLANFSNRIIQQGQFGNIQSEESKGLSFSLIDKIGGNIDNVLGTIAQVYKIDDRKIEGIAIPSPGSPYRQLHTFGFENGDNKEYTSKYFETVFKWLTTK